MSIDIPTRIAPDLAATRSVVADHLGTDAFRLAVVAMSRDDNPKATVMVVPESERAPTLAVKVALTPGAGDAVRREAGTLGRLGELASGGLSTTIPRLIDLYDGPEGTLFVATVCPGRPLSMDYHAWHHTGRQRRVVADYRCAADWLAHLAHWEVDETGSPAWNVSLRRRWEGQAVGERAADVAAALHERLALPDGSATTVLHGDYWCGNILAVGSTVTGVVDWEHAVFGADPLRDRVRFALAYSLYLDRHTRPGKLVFGHPGLRAGHWGAPLRYLLRGAGWYQDLVCDFIGDGLELTGRPRTLWRDAILLGLAEIASLSDEEEFARAHARLLVELAP